MLIGNGWGLIGYGDYGLGLGKKKEGGVVGKNNKGKLPGLRFPVNEATLQHALREVTMKKEGSKEV